MIKREIDRVLSSIFGELPPSHKIEEIKIPSMGHFSSNLAFIKRGNRNINEVAEEMVKKLRDVSIFQKVESKNGYLNFFLNQSFLLDGIRRYDDYLNFIKPGKGKRINIEFISANPTGPLNVVNARAASFGMALVNSMRFLGYEVDAEYYVNDGGSQIDNLLISLQERVKEIKGESFQIPEDGYHGEYLKEYASIFLKENPSHPKEWIVEKILKQQMESLKKLGVHFDIITRESRIREQGYPGEVLSILDKKNLLYEKDGAVWFKTSLFFDAQDRVVVKNNGEYTYFLVDLGYHLDKIKRGYHKLINILGPDHHVHVPKMKSGIKALGFPDDMLEVVIIQQVNVIKEGKRIKMSKRKGEFLTLDYLVRETGPDALKFFMLMRKASQPLDFDISLASTIGRENPVFYVQYAHARACSIFRKAGIEEYEKRDVDLSYLSSKDEFNLILKLLLFDDILQKSVEMREPSLMVHYLLELSSLFHNYYEKYRVLEEDLRLREARLFLVNSFKNVIRNGLNILGVTAPEQM